MPAARDDTRRHLIDMHADQDALRETHRGKDEFGSDGQRCQESRAL